MDWWQKTLRASELFKRHQSGKLADVRQCLAALAAAQYGDLTYIASTPFAQSFLGEYFPKLINPLVSDPTVLQKEIANYLIPPNPPPLFRTAAEHFVESFSLKRRPEDLNVDDLDFRPFTDDLNNL